MENLCRAAKRLYKALDKGNSNSVVTTTEVTPTATTAKTTAIDNNNHNHNNGSSSNSNSMQPYQQHKQTRRLTSKQMVKKTKQGLTWPPDRLGKAMSWKPRSQNRQLFWREGSRSCLWTQTRMAQLHQKPGTMLEVRSCPTMKQWPSAKHRNKSANTIPKTLSTESPSASFEHDWDQSYWSYCHICTINISAYTVQIK